MFKNIVAIVSCCLVCGGSTLWAGEQSPNLPENLVSAAIEVRLCKEKNCKKANNSEVVRPGDRFQIFVSPYGSELGYVYVVYGTPDVALQLNRQQMVTSGYEPLILPSADSYQEFAENMTSSTITVIYSAAPLPEFESLLRPSSDDSLEVWEQIEAMLRQQRDLAPKNESPIPIIPEAVSISEWKRFEELLIAQSRLVTSNDNANTKTIAGAVNVREVETCLNPNIEGIEEFIKKLIFTSGKSLVVKKYAFTLQK